MVRLDDNMGSNTMEKMISVGSFNWENDVYTRSGKGDMDIPVDGLNVEVGSDKVVEDFDNGRNTGSDCSKLGRSRRWKGNGSGSVEKLEKLSHGFLVGDFVWGKIKSHPWWPGQVYDPSDASEFALKYSQEGRYPVAFFGDGSCSWCLPSQLVPFSKNFKEKNPTDFASKRLLNAVQAAVAEVGRVVESKMTCTCIPLEKRDGLARKAMSNSGVKAGASVREVDVCRLSNPEYGPAEVLGEVINYATSVSIDSTLELTVLRSWLSAFYYAKDSFQLPVYHEYSVEGLEDRKQSTVATADDFSVTIEVPILGPKEKDLLAPPVVNNLMTEEPSRDKTYHKRKHKSVADHTKESNQIKANSQKKTSFRERKDPRKSASSLKRKMMFIDGEVAEGGSHTVSARQKGKRIKVGGSETLKVISEYSSNAGNSATTTMDNVKKCNSAGKPCEILIVSSEKVPDKSSKGNGSGVKLKKLNNEFIVGDFVWGKIKSHPWWPGKVYDTSDGSEFALKQSQKGRYLVAFFGDGSCSWCSPSQLVPFAKNFKKKDAMVFSSRSLFNAVQEAVDELGRVVESKMTCNCIPQEKRHDLVTKTISISGVKVGATVPEVDVRRLSVPEYGPAEVLSEVIRYAKSVSVNSPVKFAFLRSWLSAFYYAKDGCHLPVYHEYAVQPAVDKFGRVVEFNMVCKFRPLEKRDDLARRTVSNSVVRAGAIVSQVDVYRLSVPEYGPAEVLDEVIHYAKSVRKDSQLKPSVLTSWLSAFYYAKDGCQLPVYHEYNVEGLEDKKQTAAAAAAAAPDDLSVPIEVPILGPKEDDWLAPSIATNLITEEPLGDKVYHRKKQKSVADHMSENNKVKANSRKKPPLKEGKGSIKSASSLKRKSIDVLIAESSSHGFSARKNGKKIKVHGSETPIAISENSPNAGNNATAAVDAANEVSSAGKPNEIIIASSEDLSDKAIEESYNASTLRERKKSRYLSPPYIIPERITGISSVRIQPGPDKTSKTDQQGESAHIASENISASQPDLTVVDVSSSEKLLCDQPNELSMPSPRACPNDEKQAFSILDGCTPVSELLTSVQIAAVNPLYLNKVGTLDLAWTFISALRRSRLGSAKNPRSTDGISPKAAEIEEVLPDAFISEKFPEISCEGSSSDRTEALAQFPYIILSFPPVFRLPSKEEIVNLFSKFGSLNIEETSVIADSHSAKVVYLKNSDAETAMKSAVTDNLFGVENMNYRLQQSPAGSKIQQPSYPKTTSSNDSAVEKLGSSLSDDDFSTDDRLISKEVDMMMIAILDNYHPKLSTDDKSSLKDDNDMKNLMDSVQIVLSR